MKLDSTEKYGSVAITLPPGFSFAAAEFRNRWALQVMQHISKCDHIEAIIFDNSQLVDLVAIKNQIEIVQLEHITGYNVRVKSLQG